MLISRIIFIHLPREASLRYPLGRMACGEVSLRLKEVREAVPIVVPVAFTDVWRGRGLKGPDRLSIRGP